MSGFAHDVAGGQGNLIITQLQSPNFNMATQTGWAILKNGTAFFFSIDIEGGTIIGPDYIINTAGFFIYSSSPGAGSLIASITAASGVDGFGNSYSNGINAYPSVGSTTVFQGQQMAVGLNQVSTASTGFGFSVSNLTNPEFSSPGVFAGATPNGAHSSGPVAILDVITGRANNTDVAAEILMQSQATAGSPTNGLIQAAAGSVSLGYNQTLIANDNIGYWLFGQVLTVPPTATVTNCNLWSALSTNSVGISTAALGGAGSVGMQGAIPVTQADTTLITNTANTAYQALSKIWTVPANDVLTHTVYRLTVAGAGTWGATQEQLFFQLSGMGSGGMAPIIFGSGLFPISTAFAFKVVAELATTNATTGRCTVHVTLSVNNGNALVVANASTQGTISGTSWASPVTLVTNTATNLALQSKFGGAFGTIASAYSIFERLAA